MLKPRGFVPWGLLGPTRGRRDAAASRLASKTKGTQAWAARIIMMGGGAGVRVGPTDFTSPFPMQHSGRNGPLVGGLISSIIFFVHGEVPTVGTVP